jgi:hypothetical protein
MPRASTLFFIVAAIGLYVVGMTTPAQCALFLGMGCEIVAGKRAMDKLRAMRLARAVSHAARPLRDMHGMRGRR